LSCSCFSYRPVASWSSFNLDYRQITNVSGIDSSIEVEIVGTFAEFAEIGNVVDILSFVGNFIESGRVGLLFVDDVQVEIELVGIDGVSGDDVVEMFPVV
jgi:hypothetical protein